MLIGRDGCWLLAASRALPPVHVATRLWLQPPAHILLHASDFILNDGLFHHEQVHMEPGVPGGGPGREPIDRKQNAGSGRNRHR